MPSSSERVAIYCRVSTARQLDGYSISIQKDRGTAFAKRKGFPVDYYVEQGSGADSTRPEFNRMLDDIRRGWIGKVWVINRDRLQRSDLDEVVQIRNFFEEHGIEVWINDELLSLNSPEALLADNMKAVIAKYVRDNIRRHVKTARVKAKEQGRLHASKMYGYDLKLNTQVGKNQWVLNEKEVIGIRYMFEKYHEGVSLNAISTGLNELGIKPKMSDFWNPVKVIKVMGNPEYFGLTERTTGEMIKSQIYPAIFAAAEFTDFKRSRTKREPAARQFRYSERLLTGVMKCRECGCPFYHRSLNESYVHINYKANCKISPKNIKINVLEPLFVFSYLMVFLLPEELQTFIAEKTKERFDGLEGESRLVEITRQEIESLKRTAGGLITKLTDPAFEALADQLSAALKKVSDDIRTKEGQILLTASEREDIEDDVLRIIEQFSDEALHSFEVGSDSQRRVILKDSLSEAVMTKEKEIRIDFVNGKRFIAHIPEFRGRRPDRGNEVRQIEIDMYFREEYQISLTLDCWNFEIIDIQHHGNQEPDEFRDAHWQNLVKSMPRFLTTHRDQVFRKTPVGLANSMN
jgi:site-specific DNA recombinase